MTVDWDEGRRAHLELSEVAAATYDELYSDSNFATGSYMQYEIDVLERWAHQAPDHDQAVDLGCGTGRDSFVLAKRFEQVYAYDFSPNMIESANRNKLARNAGNVLFEVRDVEREMLDIPSASISFANSAFGMGSFIENIEPFFCEVKRILKTQGLATFSFYNANALVNQLNLQWRPALAARAKQDEEKLVVDFDGQVFEIAARAYTPTEIKHKLEGVFDLLSLSTFPTLSALFPQELFEHESARTLCTNVDQLLAENLEVAAGPYIVAVVRRQGRKRKPQELMGYERVLALLGRHNIRKDFRSHAPVRSMDDVEAVIPDAGRDEMLKSIVVAVTDHPGRDDRHPQLYLFGIPADRMLDFGKVATFLGKSRSHVRAATQTQVEELTGFTVGSIPPIRHAAVRDCGARSTFGCPADGLVRYRSIDRVDAGHDRGPP